MRGEVWRLAVGNQLSIAPELYRIFLGHAKTKVSTTIRLAMPRTPPLPLLPSPAPQLAPTRDLTMALAPAPIEAHGPRPAREKPEPW